MRQFPLIRSPFWSSANELERLFNHPLFSAGLTLPESSWESNTSELFVSKDGTTYIFRVAVPGFDKEEVDLEVTKNHILVSATKKPLEKDDGRFSLVSGGFPDSFSHKQEVRAALDPSSVKASFKDGVLQVVVHTLGKAQKPTKIVIE